MIRRLDDAPGQKRLIADAEIRCRRCGRRLRSDRAVVAELGAVCRRKERDELTLEVNESLPRENSEIQRCE